MTTAPPPPPTLPPSGGNQPSRNSPPPQPGYAARPFKTSVQETSPSPETDGEDGPPPAQLPEQNGPQFRPSQEQEDNPSEGECVPVQETEPAPQTTQQQDETAFQTDSAGEDQA